MRGVARPSPLSDPGAASFARPRHNPRRRLSDTCKPYDPPMRFAATDVALTLDALIFSKPIDWSSKLVGASRSLRDTDSVGGLCDRAEWHVAALALAGQLREQRE